MQLHEVRAGRSLIFITHFHFPRPDLSDSGLYDPVLAIGIFHGNHFGEAAVKVLLDRPQLYSWKDIPADIRRLHVRIAVGTRVSPGPRTKSGRAR